MRLGIFGSAEDAVSRHMAECIRKRGFSLAFFDWKDLASGVPCSFNSGKFIVKGDDLSDVAGWFTRQIIAPHPNVFALDGEYVLHRDWLIEYMQHKEKFAFIAAFMKFLEQENIPVVNKLEAGTGTCLKLHQLEAARKAGLLVPATLISNDVEAVSKFHAEMKNGLVVKPLIGGAHTEVYEPERFAERLKDLKVSPVIFQERINGFNVRVTVVGESFVSAAYIPTTTLDYRQDDAYMRGEQKYVPVELPSELHAKCIKLLKNIGFAFSGIDFVLTQDNKWFFLEANSSPVYLDIERKVGHKITDAILDLIIDSSPAIKKVRKALKRKKRAPSFVNYE